MTWLVTGGAGYIGSHIVRALHESGRNVVVVDDLSTGYADRVPPTVPLLRASVLDETVLSDALRRHAVTGVIHLAGKKRADESVLRPHFYRRQNVTGLECLLRSMNDAGVRRLVFSSSCSVYGSVEGSAIDESAPTRPVSPYGHTKLIGERLVRRAGMQSDVRWISLRYFNVAGAGCPTLADVAEVNLIPMIFRAMSEKRAPEIFGGDYPTPDGTCIRDYVHVVDVVAAHLAAAERLEIGVGNAVYNVGRGQGISVREMMSSIEQITGRALVPRIVDRRPGDPACVVAATDSIAAELGWTATHGACDIISSAWHGWTHLHPQFATVCELDRSGGSELSSQRSGRPARGA